MGEIWTIILRTFLTYGIIVFTFRLMGKREVGELSLLDIVVFIMVAEMAVFAIEDPNSKLFHAIVPIIVLFLIQRLVSWLSLKSQLFRGWFEGKPSVIISKGLIDEKEMRKNRYNFNDLMQQLRENGTKSVQDVEFAILEASGKLSVFEKGKGGNRKEPISPRGYVLPLVIDGKIQPDALGVINKTEKWLRDELKEKGNENIDEIFLCTLDAEDNWFIDKKD